jgi:hypothetical protein
MDRLLIVFIRQRIADRADIDLGEIFDAAEQYFKVKLEARAFFDALRAVQRERLRQTHSSNIRSGRYPGKNALY